MFCFLFLFSFCAAARRPTSPGTVPVPCARPSDVRRVCPARVPPACTCIPLLACSSRRSRDAHARGFLTGPAALELCPTASVPGRWTRAGRTTGWRGVARPFAFTFRLPLSRDLYQTYIALTLTSPLSAIRRTAIYLLLRPSGSPRSSARASPITGSHSTPGGDFRTDQP